MMKPGGDMDWQERMLRIAPQHWDITGLVAARRVLVLPLECNTVWLRPPLGALGTNVEAVSGLSTRCD